MSGHKYDYRTTPPFSQHCPKGYRFGINLIGWDKMSEAQAKQLASEILHVPVERLVAVQGGYKERVQHGSVLKFDTFDPLGWMIFRPL